MALEYRMLRNLGFALPHPFHFFRLHIVLLNGLGQARSRGMDQHGHVVTCYILSLQVVV